jgi:hypothetical protein
MKAGSVRDEYGDEGLTMQDSEDAPERIVKDHHREELESVYLNPEDNEAHAPGQVCARCGQVITAGQDARLGAEDRWVHEVCP